MFVQLILYISSSWSHRLKLYLEAGRGRAFIFSVVVQSPPILPMFTLYRQRRGFYTLHYVI